MTVMQRASQATLSTAPPMVGRRYLKYSGAVHSSGPSSETPPSSIGEDALSPTSVSGPGAAPARVLSPVKSSIACCLPRPLMVKHSRLGDHGTRSTSRWQTTIAYKI